MKPNDWEKEFDLCFKGVSGDINWEKVRAFIKEVAIPTAILQRHECYCVCHSEISSRPSCIHCERAVKLAIHQAEMQKETEIRKFLEQRQLEGENEIHIEELLSHLKETT